MFPIPRLQKLIYLRLSTHCFMEISLLSTPDKWREIFMKQSVENADKLTFVISVHKALH